MHVCELDTPALVVDLDILDRNLREMASYCALHGLSLRPHTKTHKIPAIAHLQIRSGARGITVAKLSEAELMARNGFDDIMIAYPIVGQSKLARLSQLAKKARLTISTDSLAVGEGVSHAAREAGTRISLLAEMDAGLRRCGVQSVEELVTLAQAMAKLPCIDFAGLMFFPGHVRVSPAEQVPILSEIDERLNEAQDKLHRSGVDVRTVSGGSTPTAGRSHHMHTVTEIRPGTYVFNDMNTATIGATDIGHCALTVHVTVVSTAVKGRAVIDGGSKTFSSDLRRGGSSQGFGYVPEDPGLVLESMSEEHGHLNVEAASRLLKIGDRLRVIPNHVCTAVNMHNEIWGSRHDEVVEHWDVEGRGLVR
ncbi:MAG TPA: alanine racemase [Acidobacteriota bacterium]|nr:alanine racemase [Acidobacteriota bacterium]